MSHHRLARIALVLLASMSAAPVASSRPVPKTTGPRSCQPVNGTFTNVFLTGAAQCPASPVDECTLGQLAGDLVGLYAFTFLTDSPVGADSAPVAHFTGQSHVTLATGSITGHDFGSLRTTAYPLAAFTTHLRIAAGTGVFANASGHLTIQGLASFITGHGSGTYFGQICVPK